MKKTIKRPDGTEEVVEGTAEEIAEYERKLRESPKASKKKPVLHGAEVDGVPLTDNEKMVIRLSRMGLLPQKEVVDRPIFIPQPQIVPLPYMGPVACWFCGQYNCHQNHIYCSDRTVAGTTITIGADGGSNSELSMVVDEALTSFALMNKGWTPPTS